MGHFRRIHFHAPAASTYTNTLPVCLLGHASAAFVTTRFLCAHLHTFLWAYCNTFSLCLLEHTFAASISTLPLRPFRYTPAVPSGTRSRGVHCNAPAASIATRSRYDYRTRLNTLATFCVKMTTDLLAERKRLRDEKKKIDAQMKATAAETAYATLVKRYNGNHNGNHNDSGVKMPKRLCFNLLPHRYGDTPHGNMVQDKMTMSMFFSLAELLAGSDIIKVVGDETYFQLATELLNDQPLPRLWSVLIPDWIEESPDLAPAFFSGMFSFGKMQAVVDTVP